MCVHAVLICVQTGTMGKACTVYKDIGKLANDLLTKDFKQVGKTTVEIESKTASGVVSAVVLPPPKQQPSTRRRTRPHACAARARAPRRTRPHACAAPAPASCADLHAKG